MIDIPLSQLLPHPDNCNAMPEALMTKLIAAIKRSGRYPPLIVRPYDAPGAPETTEDTYQILDGHHRLLALKQLGHASARCVVWPASDEEALLLLATLNRLQGQDDLKQRARLVGQLQRHLKLDTEGLAQLLPEDHERLDKLLSLNDLPAPTPPKSLNDLPVAVHFFLLPEQKRALERKLAAQGPSREAALLTLIGIENQCPEVHDAAAV